MKVTAIIVASIVASAPAFAATPDVAERQAQIRDALGRLGVPLGGDELSFGPRGRRDLVLFSPRPRDAIMASLKAIYRGDSQLAHGFRVAGWGRLVKTNTYTFTLKDPSDGAWVIELADDGGGSRISIWGVGRTLLPERRPRIELPMRLIAPE